MRIIPYQKNTWVSHYSPDELHQKMKPLVRPADERPAHAMAAEYSFLGKKLDEKYYFEGITKPNRYYLRRISLYPEHFMPVISANIEATSRGSIVSLLYSLPKGTLFIAALGTFVFWCVICVFLFAEKNYMSAGLVFLFWFIGYVVMILNFKQKLKISQKLIEKILA
jgi:hypothetical protein